MSTPKKKIGIFCGYYLPHLGGVERYVDKISAALMNLDYDVVIVTSNHEDLAYKEDIDGRTVYRLPIRNFAKNRYPIPNKNEEYKKIITEIEHENIDYYFLQTRFHLTSLIGAKMGKRLGKPVLLVEHGTGHFTVNNRVLDVFGSMYEHWLTAKIKKYVDKFYGVSQNCNKWLKHFGINATGVFYNAINKSDANKVKDLYKDKWPEDEVVITYAGRLLKEKGIVNLLDAFTAIKDKYPRLRLVVAGDGGLLNSLKLKYKDDQIDFLGRLDFEHVMALYKRTNIFVYPSLYPEGLPTSILEAGLVGCAIIATPRGGTEEVIVDDRHGIITSGSVDDIQRSLEDLVIDPNKAKSMADMVKKRIETVFDWEAVAKVVKQELEKFGE